MTNWHAVARGGTRAFQLTHVRKEIVREKGNSVKYTMLKHACHRVPRGNYGHGGTHAGPVVRDDRTKAMKTLKLHIQHRPIALAATHASTASDQWAASAERVRIYHSGRWQRARLRHLRDHPLCVECTAAGLVVAAVAVDHRDGHRTGNWRDRFWDEALWQSLCLDCHNAKSAKELAEWNRLGGTRAGQGEG